MSLRPSQLIALLYMLLVFVGCNRNEYIMPTGSMEPTIKEGERFAVNPQAYHSIADIRRWDIIVYAWHDTGNLTVKRVAGLPGETIEWSEKGVMIDGLPLEIPDDLKTILKDFRGPQAEAGRQRIPNDAIFVIGDRINGSKDSRYDGPVKFGAVKGRSF